MNKSELLKFIELYNLNGTVEAVKLVATDKGLKTSIVSECKTLAGTVSFSSLKIDEGEYGIHDTAQFKKMLGVLADEDINVTVSKSDNRAISLCISDKTIESVCMLADLSVIPSAPKVKEIKNFDVEIPIDDSFVERFVRAKNALPDVDTFTIMPNKKDKLELVIGHSSINTNRIKLDINPIDGKDKLKEGISFNANYFKEILSKNRGVNSIYKIASAGISTIHFKTDGYEATYYLIKKNTE